jgi:site-specific recombinase XerD
MFLTKRRGWYYLAFFTDDGRRVLRSTHARTKLEATQFLRAFNAEQYAERRALQSITLKAFKDSYVTFCRKIHTAKSVESSDMALRVFNRHMGADMVMHTITPTACERFLAARATESSALTVLRLYRTLAAAFERARSWGHILENPWRKVKKPKAPELIPAYFTREQFKALLGVIQDRDLRELATLGALTGLRQGELLAMRWDWVNFERRVLTVKNSEHFTTKSKRVRVVPLVDGARAVLLARRERANDEGLVFTRKGRALEPRRVSESFKDAVTRAKLPEALHFHSTRHSFASWLVQGGVSLYQVAKLLGHSSTAVTEQYAHLVPSDMHAVLAPLHFEN